MAGISWAKRLTPAVVRGYKMANRIGMKYSKGDIDKAISLGRRAGLKIRATPGFRRASRMRTSLVLGGIGGYIGNRYRKRHRVGKRRRKAV